MTVLGGAAPPGPLRPGDRVALVAPAGPTPPDRLTAGVALLASWGLEPVLYPSATASHTRAKYLSGSDGMRSGDVENAWCDPTIAGIFCIRGGYGTVRMLDGLDAGRMRDAAAKPVYGSSDITALHEWLREQLGASSWFTPMITSGALLDDAAATESLRRSVFESAAGRRWGSGDAEILVPGHATGVTIGGNLSLLAMTAGARGRPPLDNTGGLALLEDVTEDTYRIDGYLQNLLRAGWFDGVSGIALGSWFECGPLDEVRAVCRELLEPLGVPLVWELGFGHGPAAPSVPLGVRARLISEPGAPPALQAIGPAPTPTGSVG